MKLQFLWVGKTRTAPIKQLLDDYLGRIGRFAQIEVGETRDRNSGGRDASVVEREAVDLISRLREGAFVVALDQQGVELDSIKMARLIEQHQARGTKSITFVLGGHRGLAGAVRQRADLVLSLSRMTLTHELARVFLLEQVYRAFAIIHGLPYQR
jgi:23S rRNA (pseudouridine1915-N3)-methyltransferase